MVPLNCLNLFLKLFWCFFRNFEDYFFKKLILSFLNFPQIIHILKKSFFRVMVWENAFCWNSPIRNKHAEAYVCDSVPAPSPSVLAYAYGFLKDFAEFVLSSKAQKKSAIISACSPGILSGMYDMGISPSVSFFGENDLRVVALHHGIATLPTDPNTTQCGISNLFDGLVLDGWPVDYLNKMV